MRIREAIKDSSYISILADGKELVLIQDCYQIYRVPVTKDHPLYSSIKKKVLYAIYDTTLLWNDTNSWKYYTSIEALASSFKKLTTSTNKLNNRFKCYSQCKAEKELTNQ